MINNVIMGIWRIGSRDPIIKLLDVLATRDVKFALS
jgi:hypothetical protein